MNESIPVELEGRLPRYLSDDRPVREFQPRSFVTTGHSLASQPPGAIQQQPTLDPRAAAQPATVLQEINGNSHKLLKDLLTASLQLSQLERALTPEELLLLSTAMHLHLQLAERAKSILNAEAQPVVPPEASPRRGGRAAPRAPKS